MSDYTIRQLASIEANSRQAASKIDIIELKHELQRNIRDGFRDESRRFGGLNGAPVFVSGFFVGIFVGMIILSIMVKVAA